MTGNGHRIFAASIATAATATAGLPQNQALTIVGLAVLTSGGRTSPDVDLLIPPKDDSGISVWHRKGTHYLATAVLIAYIAHQAAGPVIALGVTLGLVTHWIADAMTPDGAPHPLAPLIRRPV